MRETIESILNGEREAGLWGPPLAGLSLLYGAATVLRNYAYDHGALHSYAVDRPIISVGALTVGGVGKTPFTRLLAARLADKKVAILLRGYGATCGDYSEVSDGKKLSSPPPVSADEAFLLARSLPALPVITAPDRVRGAQRIIEKFSPDLILLDDGFAHRRLRRDVNIVMLDGRNPFGGNGWLLPRGPLREPVSALSRADLIILTGEEAPATRAAVQQAAGKNLSFVSVEGKISDFTDIDGNEVSPPTGKNIRAFAGIARPHRFWRALEREGMTLNGTRAFGDHHPYSENEIITLLAETKEAPLLTTEKDAVRLLQFAGRIDLSSLVVARYTMTITEGEEILDQAVAAL